MAPNSSDREIASSLQLKKAVDEGQFVRANSAMLIMRPATLDDAGLLFAWRNDPVTRAMSKNTEPVAWQSHLHWLTASFANENRILLVGEVDGIGIGTARLDRDGDQVVASFTVDQKARGRCLGGYGTILLRKACAAAAERWGLFRSWPRSRGKTEARG